MRAVSSDGGASAGDERWYDLALRALGAVGPDMFSEVFGHPVMEYASANGYCLLWNDWCWLSTRATNQQGEGDPQMHPVDKIGYVQYKQTLPDPARLGRNRQFTLGLIHRVTALMTSGGLGAKGFDASHLCGHSTCFRLGHVVWESKTDNNNRKTCQVWVHDPYRAGEKYIHCCPHSPSCIKPIPGVSYEQFISRPEDYYVVNPGVTLPFVPPSNYV